MPALIIVQYQHAHFCSSQEPIKSQEKSVSCKSIPGKLTLGPTCSGAISNHWCCSALMRAAVGLCEDTIVQQPTVSHSCQNLIHETHHPHCHAPAATSQVHCPQCLDQRHETTSQQLFNFVLLIGHIYFGFCRAVMAAAHLESRSFLAVSAALILFCSSLYAIVCLSVDCNHHNMHAVAVRQKSHDRDQECV